MADETKTCGNCLYLLPETNIEGYGYCIKRDALKPRELSCYRWQPRSEELKKKEGEK